MKIIRLFLHVSLFSVILYASQLLLSEVLEMYQRDSLKASPSALNLLQDEAKNGNSNAAFLLATAYKNGKAGEVNLAKALYWYKISANRGDADAMLMLGWLYYKQTSNTQVSIKKARYWFKKAAAKGVDEAIEMLEILAH